MEPRWLTLEVVKALHAETVAAAGGSMGIRDAGLLEGALDRARNLFAYGNDPTMFDLAAAYCVGIVRNHPFIDGNKRIGYVAAHTFLEYNGFEFEPPEVEIVAIIIALAAGEIDEIAVAQWFADHSRLRTG